MKIAFCTDGIFPHAVGGMQRHSRLLIEELAKSPDVQITVFHPHSEKIFKNFPNVEEIMIEDIDKSKNYLKENYKYSERIFQHLSAMPEHIVYSQGLSVLYNMAKLPNKIIVNPHGLEPYQTLGFKDKLIAIPFRFIFNNIFRKADFVVSLGGRLTDILKKIVSDDKIVILPNGVNLPINFSPKKKSEHPVILLFVGRFASNKGIDLLLEVASDLNSEGYSDKISYKLAGKGPLWNEMQKKYPLSNVDFLGFVTDEQLSDLYADSHAFILPTLFEGMPTVVHEAMTHELPIFVSDVGATAEQVDSTNGYLLPRSDKQALKKAILDFVQKKQSERDFMGKKSLEKVKSKFLWEKVAEKHLTFFKKQSKTNI